MADPPPIGDLRPIPEEGGWFAPGPRTAALSSITVLLTDAPDGFSALHRLTVDEGWQWLDGSAVDLVTLPGRTSTDADPDASTDTDAGAAVTVLDAQRHQHIVPAGTWLGARPRGAWALLACWCSPAFTDPCFTLGDREDLLARYPQAGDWIGRLTR